MFVKICGITDREAAQAAVAAGADALGFVFAASPRQVSAEIAREIAADVPRSTLRVAVFHHPPRAHFAHVLAVFAPDWVQTDAEDLASLPVPAGTFVLPVFRSGGGGSGGSGFRRDQESRLKPLLQAFQPLPSRLLYEGPRSGTGTAADWTEAQKLAAATEVVLAGGLSAANIEAAVAQVRPWGIDVSTGVERAPGRKDPDKIRAFVARARALEH
ncbi:MAG TPA: phosphoribosylanthranilate isomerase [Gammaproteobacteria bacterium]|jgi:phosphoribosylanthranilate isomerase